MTLFTEYFLKLSISLAIVWIFYQFVLRRLTFYNSNRWYLLGYTLFSFIIPFINISPILQKNEWNSNVVVSWVPVIEEYKSTAAITPGYHFSPATIIMFILYSGIFIMLLRLIFQLLSFRRMKKGATVIPSGSVNLFQVDQPIIPFSFGDAIFINQHLHTPEELEDIIRHEFVHVKQRHSLDMIWAELLCLVNWFNPFAWLLKKSIRQNLEFIADNEVLENGIDKKQYQYLLLKVIGNNQFSIAPKFNFSSLKKRIAMMNKLKSARLHLVRFLFILPLLAVVLLSFRKQYEDSTRNQGRGHVTMARDFMDTVPDVTDMTDKGYYIDIKGKDGNSTVVVKDKNHKEVDRILLIKWKEKQDYYDNLYGALIPPPPTPPVPPLPPVPMKLPAGVERINVTDSKADVLLKDGKKETYDLKAPADKATFEKKYGDIIPVPPTPPTPPSRQFELSAVQEVNRASIADRFEISDDNKAHIRLKDGTSEDYNLANAAEKKKFETKYGRIIQLPSTAESADMASTVSVVNNEGVLVPTKVSDVDGALVISDEGQVLSGHEEILLTVTRKTSRAELDNFIKQMQERGIELKFDEVNYDDGTLTHIDGKMKYKDGNCNFSATDFNKVIISSVSNDKGLHLMVRIMDKKVVI